MIDIGENLYASPRYRTSPTLGQLGTALALAQGEIKGAIRDSENPHLHSKYADLAAVWDACRGPLSRNGLAVVQCPDADGPKVTLTTLLIHSSGEYITSVLSLTSNRDKFDGPQVAGSAITYARRYALAAMIGVAPDDDDAEAAMVRPDSPRNTQRPARPVAVPAPPLGVIPAPKDLPWRDRPAMEAAFGLLRDLVGDQFYLKALAEYGVTLDLRGKVAKLTEAYLALQLRATQLAQEGAAQA